jgi:PST family polysaccharide transporter
MWMSAGNAVRAILRVGVLAVLARLLTPEDFGLVGAAGIVLWLGHLFTSLGAGPAIQQRKDLEPRHVATGFAISVGLGVLIGGLLYLLAPTVAAALRLPSLPPVLRALSPIFPLMGVSLVAESLLLRDLRFGRVTGAELVSYGVGYGVIGIALAVAGAGVWALVIAELGKQIVKTVMLIHAVPHSVRPGLDRDAFRSLMSFGSGYTVGGLSGYVAAQADKFVIARYLGAGALGLYGHAYDLMVVPASALGTVLDKILLPTMARVQEDRVRLGFAFRRSTALVALLVLPLSAGTAVLAPEIVLVLLGPRWGGAVMPLRILTAAMYFRVGYMMGHSVANATGAVYRSAGRSVAYALLVVVGAAVGVRWGIAGVAAGVTVAVSVNFLAALQLGIAITGLAWRTLAVIHLRAVLLAAIVGGAALAVATLARDQGAGAPLVLLAAAAVVAPLTALLLRVNPGHLLGPDGIWLMDLLCQSTPRALQPLVRGVLGRPAP